MPSTFKLILASVGRNGINSFGDRRVVMHLLNQVSESDGGSSTLLIESDPLSDLVVAIERFQNRNFGFADGRVDVEGKTLRLLRELDSDPGGPVLLPTIRSGKKSSGRKKSTETLKRIFAPVGRNGINTFNDTRLVKHLMNQVPESDGGSNTVLIEPDPISDLVVAIDRFQNRNFGFADGRVDVEGRTLRLLREFDSDPGGPVVLPTIRSGKKSSGRKKST